MKTKPPSPQGGRPKLELAAQSHSNMVSKMARSYSFAVLRLAPDPARGEAVNLGIVVFRESEVDVRIGEVITRARLLYPEATAERLHEGVELFRRLGSVPLPIRDRHRSLSQLGLFALGELGHFTVDSDEPATTRPTSRASCAFSH